MVHRVLEERRVEHQPIAAGTNLAVVDADEIEQQRIVRDGHGILFRDVAERELGEVAEESPVVGAHGRPVPVDERGRQGEGECPDGEPEDSRDQADRRERRADGSVPRGWWRARGNSRGNSRRKGR